MTLNELYREAKGRLRAAGIENPAFDAACIFEKHTGVPRGRLPLCGGEPAGPMPALERDLARRIAGEPLQYILGEWEFMGLPFRVGSGVLIPRPETELLAETAIGHLRGKNGARLLELCAGSGCVTVSVARAVCGLEAWCLEKSDEAIRYLDENIRLNGVESRVRVIRGDMLDFAGNAGLPRRLDAIVCNPPYICSGDIPALQREVRDHEPALALDGGEDGLAFYHAAGPWAGLLAPGGLMAFEVGAGQARDVAALLRGAGLDGVFVKSDPAGIERVVGGYRAGR